MTIAQGEHTSSGWTPDDGSFGARLALVRQRMKWGNVKQAAVECGLPPESWRTWERDGVTPRSIVEITALIAERTGCDRWWLLTGEHRHALNDATGRSHLAAERPGWIPTEPDKPHDRPPNRRPQSSEYGPVARPSRVPRLAAR